MGDKSFIAQSQQIKRKRGRPRKPRVLRLCDNEACGNCFEKPYNSTQRYCGSPCFFAARRKFKPGNGHIPFWDKARAEKMYELAIKLNSIPEAAREIGVTRAWYYYVLKRWGLPTKVYKAIEKPPKPIRYCKVCGHELGPRRSVYCSYQCHNRARNYKVEDCNRRTCDHCDIVFYRKDLGRGNRSVHWFCCPDHYYEYQREHPRYRIRQIHTKKEDWNVQDCSNG